MEDNQTQQKVSAFDLKSNFHIVYVYSVSNMASECVFIFLVGNIECDGDAGFLDLLSALFPLNIGAFCHLCLGTDRVTSWLAGPVIRGHILGLDDWCVICEDLCIIARKCGDFLPNNSVLPM